MTDVSGDTLARVDSLADRSGWWPLLCDPQLNFVTPQLKSTLAVWEAKRGTRRMPARADMTIQDLKFVLPQLALLGIVREGDRVRYKVRLMGSELDTHVLPMTGRFIDEAVPPRFAEKWCALWGQAVEARGPIRTAARVEFRERRSTVAETFYAPLADDGETPDVLMVANFHHLYDDAEPPHAIAAQLIRELEARKAALV